MPWTADLELVIRFKAPSLRTMCTFRMESLEMSAVSVHGHLHACDPRLRERTYYKSGPDGRRYRVRNAWRTFVEGYYLTGDALTSCLRS